MTFKSVEAASGSNQSSSQNQFNCGRNQSDFRFDSATFLTNLQADLTAHLVQHKTIRLACRCFACCKAKSPLKMFAGSPLCRDCINEFRGKGKTAKSNFIEKAKANFGRFLRGVVATG